MAAIAHYKKKGLVVLLTMTIVFLLGTLPAYADYVWPHNGYDPASGTCGYCHLSLTPADNPPLQNSDVVALCLTCHNGSGSKYNVDAGTVNGVYPTAGGGFEIYTSVKTITSRHDLNKVFYTVPGSSKQNLSLNCATCHNPHGSPNYRMLKTSLYGVPINVAGEVVIGATGEEKVYYLRGMDEFCSVCHEQFYNNTDSTYYLGAHRHRVGMDPLQAKAEVGYKPDHGLPLELNDLSHDVNNNPDTVSCMTCHKAHSTTVRPVYSPTSFYFGRSSLLRLDGSGVCYACHDTRVAGGITK